MKRMQCLLFVPVVFVPFWLLLALEVLSLLSFQIIKVRYDNSVNSCHIILSLEICKKEIQVSFTLFLESCLYKETDKFYVTFRNSDVHPIDIKLLYPTEQLMTSRLMPGKEVIKPANFNQGWKFLRSNTTETLMATGNGVTSKVFKGCKYKAKPNEIILLNIIRGKKPKVFLSLHFL